MENQRENQREKLLELIQQNIQLTNTDIETKIIELELQNALLLQQPKEEVIKEEIRVYKINDEPLLYMRRIKCNNKNEQIKPFKVFPLYKDGKETFQKIKSMLNGKLKKNDKIVRGNQVRCDFDRLEEVINRCNQQ
ncbi:Hypothetical_protein [Hexamita inflata]|uniref:Hypothetical_protein n=1 Tax=Hexamita inflata TaxID=28002 RepID=A0AA86TN11_9EUKA|nr:Hypothetical protein HINF_LOCUS11189 [Hexamita inflata]